MKLYVAGPMSGLPRFNYPVFDLVTNALRSRGYEVVSPAETELDHETATYDDFMREGLSNMLKCDGVAVIEGHLQSKGAMYECKIARDTKMPILHWAMWYDHEADEVDLVIAENK